MHASNYIVHTSIRLSRGAACSGPSRVPSPCCPLPGLQRLPTAMLPGYGINNFDAVSRLNTISVTCRAPCMVLTLAADGVAGVRKQGHQLLRCSSHYSATFSNLSAVFCDGLHKQWACAMQASSPTLARALLCSCPPPTTLPRRRSSQALSSGLHSRYCSPAAQERCRHNEN